MPQPNQKESADRTPELDGVRGLALLLIIAYHTFKRADGLTNSDFLHRITDLTRLGWVGVDIFFVLSGFLITGILLRTKGSPHFFKFFYVRRILRIFPLYYLFLVPLLFSLPLLDRIEGETTKSLWPIFLLYQQNWLYILKPEPSLLVGFTWTLAIEEQFYFLWPALVYFLSKRVLLWASIAFIISSLLLRVIMLSVISGDNIANIKDFFFYGPLIRFEGLIFGGLIALAFHVGGIWKERITHWALPTFIIGIGLFALLCFTGTPNPLSNNNIMPMFSYTLLAFITGSLLVLLTTRPTTSLVRRIFRNKGLLFLGKYSYAMYMSHLPILVILLEVIWQTHRQNGWMWFFYIFASFGLTTLFGLLSWNLIEKHALKLKKYFE